MSRIRGWRWLRLAVGLIVAALVVGGGYAAYAAKTGGPTGYRTATVEKADVEQTVSLSGTVAQLGESDLSFGASGTVASVKVAVGDHVRKGQVLAGIDTAALQAAVTKANSALAAARAQLASDEQAQIDQATTSSTGGTTTGTSGGSSTGGTSGSTHQGGTLPSSGSYPGGKPSGGTTSGGTTNGGGTSPSGGTSGTPGSGTVTADTVKQIRAAQAQVEAAQQQLDGAQAQLTDSSTGAKTYLGDLSTALEALHGSLADDGDLAKALSDAQADCGSADDATKCDDDIQAAIDALDSAQNAVPGTDDGSDLAKAQQAVADAADDVTAAQSALATAVSDLDKLVTSGSGPTGGSSGAVHTSAATSRDAQDDTVSGDHVVTAAYVTSVSSSGSSTGFSGGGQTVSAATVAEDQASIDQAKADLITARQDRAGGQIRATASGTIAEVSVSKGDAASAGSTAVVVIAPGLATVHLSASSTQIQQLKVGQKAEVTPAGATRALAGKVTSVSNVPDGSSSTTYPVTVTLAKRDSALLVGTTASVDVVTGEADGALTVPTSAVSNGVVEVLDGSSVQRVRVTIGVVGRTRTVVTGGLQAGQQVVLADLSAALPTGDSTQQRGFGGAGGVGGFGGGFGTTGGFGGTAGFSRRG